MRFACERPSSGAAARLALALQGQLPTIVTDHLLLRAPRVEDFETYAGILCSERGRFMGGPMSREDAWADFCNVTANWLLHGHGVWTIGNAAGVAGFVTLGLEPGDREPELGFFLAPHAEGRNIAFEAAKAVKGYAFETLGWKTLVSYVSVGNTRSATLARRLGGHIDGEIAGETDAEENVLIYRYAHEVLQ